MAVARGAFDEEADLCIRAAWLHYGGGFTQGEVAARLGVPTSRLIASSPAPTHRASCGSRSMARSAPASRSKHRSQNATAFLLPGRSRPRRRSAALEDAGAGGQPLSQAALLSGEHKMIGFGHGRTLAACVAGCPA